MVLSLHYLFTISSKEAIILVLKEASIVEQSRMSAISDQLPPFVKGLFVSVLKFLGLDHNWSHGLFL